MAKDPAFLFYPNDWQGGTMGMTLEQKGAYIEVLMLQCSRGHMTEHMIVHMIGQTLWDNIKVKFIQDDDDLWFNQRLELEKEKRKRYVESRTNNKLGINQHSKNGHMTSHMGNGNNNIKGVKFLKNGFVEFSDGSTQELGEKQKEYVEAGDFKPHNIFKGSIY